MASLLLGPPYSASKRQDNKGGVIVNYSRGVVFQRSVVVTLIEKRELFMLLSVLMSIS